MFHEALENQQRSLNHLQMWTLQCFEVVFVRVCPCVTCTRVPLTVRRGCWTPWSWGHRCCEPLLWVLGIKLWSSAGTASALNLRVTSLAWPPKFFFFETVFQCSPGYPWTHYVARDHLELLVSLCRPLKCWDSRGAPPALFYAVLGWNPGLVYTRQATLPAELHLQPWIIFLQNTFFTHKF